MSKANLVPDAGDTWLLYERDQPKLAVRTKAGAAYVGWSISSFGRVNTLPNSLNELLDGILGGALGGSSSSMSVF